MSIDVALQSVVFYVLSCSTCSKISHRRKTRHQAKKEREERELEIEQPGLYRHPSPFSTNPFWDEEIMLGPGPPKRKGDKNGSKCGSKNGSSRALTTAGPGSSVMSGTTSTDAGSSPTMVAVDHRVSGEDWNRKRYQREDEILWGQKLPHTGQKFMDALARAGNSVGITDRILGGRLTKIGASKGEDVEEEEEEVGSYYIARNPPVNDLHPPIVSSQPTHKGATRWMMQPPPPAKVMEGKERANRSRSDSSASSRKGADCMNLGRQVSSRLVEAKLKNGETPDPLSMANPISKPKAAFTRNRYREDTTGTLSTDSSDASVGAIKRKRRPPPISISPSRKMKDEAEHIPIPNKPFEVSSTFRLAPESRAKDSTSRPALATIASSSQAILQAQTSMLTDSQNSQPPQSIGEGIPNNSTNEPSESLKKTSKNHSVVIPKVHHSFQGKETFVFPPPKSKYKENEMIDYDADGEDEESGERMIERSHIIQV